MVRIVIRFFEAPRMGLEPSKRSQHHSNRVTRRGEHTARTNGDFLVKSVASTEETKRRSSGASVFFTDANCGASVFIRVCR